MTRRRPMARTRSLGVMPWSRCWRGGRVPRAAAATTVAAITAAGTRYRYRKRLQGNIRFGFTRSLSSIYRDVWREASGGSETVNRRILAIIVIVVIAIGGFVVVRRLRAAGNPA